MSDGDGNCDCLVARFRREWAAGSQAVMRDDWPVPISAIEVCHAAAKAGGSFQSVALLLLALHRL